MTGPAPQRRIGDQGADGLATAVDELRVQMRAIAPVAATVAQHDAELDALKESLDKHEDLVRDRFDALQRDAIERFDRAFRKLDTINDHVQRTNGRVTSLEQAAAIDAALRKAAAEAIDDRRRDKSLRLAEHGWVRPTIAGGVIGLIATAVNFAFEHL